MKALSADELNTYRSSLSMWTFESKGAYMEREFLFKDFLEAFAFMSKVAELAHAQDHHPNWSNVYRQVNIRLFTHDCSALSMKDILLAQSIDQLFTQSM